MFAITALKVLMMIAYGVPGYILVKTKLVGQDTAKVFAKLLLYVCSPALCIQTLNSVDCTKENLISMGIFFFSALFAQIAVILIYTLLFRKKVKTDKGHKVCAVAGAFAGQDIRRLWAVPLIGPAAFLAGTWLFFEMGEPAFLVYSGCYLLIGSVAMGISALIKARKTGL